MNHSTIDFLTIHNRQWNRSLSVVLKKAHDSLVWLEG